MAHLSTYFSLENALPGVTSVSVSGRGCVAVDYDTTGVRQEQIRQRVQELGYQLRATD